MPYNSSRGVSNALTAAAAGAKAGSVVPLVGSALGGLGGLIAGGLTGFERDPQKKLMKQQNKKYAQQFSDKVAQAYFNKHGYYPTNYKPSAGYDSTPGAPGESGSVEGSFQRSPNLFNQQQQDALNFLLTHGKGIFENPYAGFEPIEQE